MKTCIVCSKPKATHTCRDCSGDVCKSCTQFISLDRFSFFEKPKDEQYAGSYCLTCYQANVAPIADEYDALMAEAENVSVYFIEQSKETRLIKRNGEKLKIEDCSDRDELILRLAFRAVQAGCNTILDTNLTYEKHRDGSFKIANWKGTAIAANLDERNRPRESKLKSPSR